ncbi:response regulator [Nocardia asteroides]|uniref:response regulator n=1 Tax=Nocardia asteroides TaxID=1824 RepID=UPI001E5A82F2|nr:response regulator [Nocardia asteroides]UGT61746.1 response regulator [Nocardia asteroides]
MGQKPRPTTAPPGRARPVCLRDYWASPARVLLVEDDPATAEMITIVLAGQSLIVDHLAAGAQAAAYAQKHRPGLILLDLMLTDLHGVAVCRALRAVCATPIVIVSATREEAVIAAAMAAGAHDYLPKPFAVHDLLAHVDTHLPPTSAPLPITLPGPQSAASSLVGAVTAGQRAVR